MDKNQETYEKLYQELEASIELLQSGELSLDEAVSKYERSIELISKLEEHLKSAENKVKKLKNSVK